LRGKKYRLQGLQKRFNILINTCFKNFLKDQSGTTAIEYCMIAAAMCAALVIAMPFITTGVSAKWVTLGSSINSFK
jgi:Flp pilus assembly pilin Flp